MAKYYDVGDNEWYDYEPSYYSEREADEDSFYARYADEIEGRAEYPVPPPEEMPALQLSLFAVTEAGYWTEGEFPLRWIVAPGDALR